MEKLQKENILLIAEKITTMTIKKVAQSLNLFEENLDVLFKNLEFDEIKAIWQAAFTVARWPKNDFIARKSVSLLFNCIKRYDKLFKEQCLIDNSFSKVQRIRDDYNGLLKVLKLSFGLLPERARWLFIKKMKTEFVKLQMNLVNNHGISKAYFDYVGPQRNYEQNNDVDLMLLCSQEGGVGKSLMSLLITFELSRRGKKCLLLEMDFGGGAFGYLGNFEDCLSNYDILYESSDLNIGKLVEKKSIYRIKDSEINIIHSPLNHEFRAGLVTRLLIQSRSADIRRRLFDLVSWAGNRYSHIIIDLPSGFGPEALIAFALALETRRTKTILIAKPALNSVILPFEWINRYCLGKNSKAFLLVNKVSENLSHLWNSPKNIADNIFENRGGVDGFPRAMSSEFIRVLMPWNKVTCFPDIPVIREISNFSDVARVCKQNEKEIGKIMEMIVE